MIARDLVVAVDGAWGAACATALLSAQWTLVDQFEQDGRRYFVARRGAQARGCSAREREVLRCAARGLTNKEIAYELDIRASTVATHLCNAIRRIGVRDRWLIAAIQSQRDARATLLDSYAVVSHPVSDSSLGAIARLTSAELEVAALAARGRSNSQIACARGTSVLTVANQMKAILRKLDLSGRGALCARWGNEVVSDTRSSTPLHRR